MGNALARAFVIWHHQSGAALAAAFVEMLPDDKLCTAGDSEPQNSHMRCVQVTAFVALLALDERRIAARRLDIAPCLRLPASVFGPADLEQTLAGAPPPSAPSAADTAAAESAPDDVVDAAEPEGHAASATAERPGEENAGARGVDASGRDTDGRRTGSAVGTSAKLDGVQSPGPSPSPGLAASGGAYGATAGTRGVDGERWARASAAGPADADDDVSGSRAGPAQAWGLSRALQALVAERYAPWLLRPSVQACPHMQRCWVWQAVSALATA